MIFSMRIERVIYLMHLFCFDPHQCKRVIDERQLEMMKQIHKERIVDQCNKLLGTFDSLFGSEQYAREEHEQKKRRLSIEVQDVVKERVREDMEEWDKVMKEEDKKQHELSTEIEKIGVQISTIREQKIGKERVRLNQLEKERDRMNDVVSGLKSVESEIKSSFAATEQDEQSVLEEVDKAKTQLASKRRAREELADEQKTEYVSLKKNIQLLEDDLERNFPSSDDSIVSQRMMELEPVIASLEKKLHRSLEDEEKILKEFDFRNVVPSLLRLLSPSSRLGAVVSRLAHLLLEEESHGVVRISSMEAETGFHKDHVREALQLLAEWGFVVGDGDAYRLPMKESKSME
jgi:chromosome segregation ATPase